MTLEHLWAGWRMAYVSSVGAEGPQRSILGELAPTDCVFCAIIEADAPEREKLIVWQADMVVAMLNAFPYAPGHVMVMPRRHLRDLEELTTDEEAALWGGVRRACTALKGAYRPDGYNLGLNLGRAAGAGIPEHLHVHAVPRWAGDTNFMTATASVRVLPEALDESWRRLTEAWR
jgi:ATP adenylyltransferase